MGMRLRRPLGLIILALAFASVWLLTVLHAQWSREIGIAESEAAAEVWTATHTSYDDSFPRIPVRPDTLTGIDFSLLLDRTPLFVTSIPKGYIGSRAVLEVRILRFANVGECTREVWSTSIKHSENEQPTAFALAEVLSVKRGTFGGSLVLLCGADGFQHFLIGEKGLVYGTPSENKEGNWRLGISETYARRTVRRRSEGAHCFLALCFDAQDIF
jgi:hypothetical protein